MKLTHDVAPEAKQAIEDHAAAIREQAVALHHVAKHVNELAELVLRVALVGIFLAYCWYRFQEDE